MLKKDNFDELYTLIMDDNIKELKAKFENIFNVENKYGETLFNVENKYGETLLELAIKFGKNKSIEYILEIVPIECFLAKNSNDESIIHILSKYEDDTKYLRAILKRIKEKYSKEKYLNILHQPSKNNNSPLHIAARYGNSGTLKLLIQEGANINLPNKDRQTPLHIASLYDMPGSIEILLENKAITNIRDSYKLLPIEYIKFSKVSKECLEAFQKNIPMDICSDDEHQDSKDNDSDDFKEKINIFDILYNVVNMGDNSYKLNHISAADINICNKHGLSPLNYLVYKGRLDLIVILKNRKANINFPDGLNRTPLYIAVVYNKKDIVEYLLQNGASIEIVSIEGMTAYEKAEKLNNDCLEVFEHHKQKIKEEYRKKITEPIFKLYKSFLSNISRFFIAEEKDPKTILKSGIEEGDLNKVHRALSMGLDINKVLYEDGYSPLHLAVREGRPKIAQLFIYIGAIKELIEKPDKYGKRPTHIAARYGRLSCLKILDENNANMFPKDRYGYTPSYWAKQSKSKNCVDYYLRNFSKYSTLDIDSKEKKYTELSSESKEEKYTTSRF